ncbi:TPA: hypothetical protein JD264_23990 [Serratia fonticola]|nr:hypothetical protein [Serratia fonticola]
MDVALLQSLDINGREKFDEAISALQDDISTITARLSIDSRLRLESSKRIKQMTDGLGSPGRKQYGDDASGF